MSLSSQSIPSVFGPEDSRSAQQVRHQIRQGVWHSHTSGLASDHVQGNVVILPEALANDFLRYCQRNPKPCPLLAVSEPGQALLPDLGADIDIRTDPTSQAVERVVKLALAFVEGAPNAPKRAAKKAPKG